MQSANASPIFVFNLHKRFTGVSATIAAVTPHLAKSANVYLVGYPLPGCPKPIGLMSAVKQVKVLAPKGAVWHVRRNKEMLAGIIARDILRLPIRLVFTSAAQRRHSAFPRWLISKMDAVIATSDIAASFVPNVFSVVPHGVDCNRFQPAKDRSKAWQELGFGGSRGLAAIGRVRPEKGTDVFVETMIEVLPHFPDCVALVVGLASQSHEAFLLTLKQNVAKAGLSERILFIGEVKPEDMPKLARSLSLLVALPRYEGFGLTPLEAMASGVPFVGTDTGVFAEFSNKGRAGFVVPIENALPQATKAITILLNDDVLLREFAENARLHATCHYSSETEASEIFKVYAHLSQAARKI